MKEKLDFDHSQENRLFSGHEINEARQYIAMIRQQVASMGANDSELPDMERIEKELILGKISPKKAKDLVNNIFKQKSDYH